MRGSVGGPQAIELYSRPVRIQYPRKNVRGCKMQVGSCKSTLDVSVCFRFFQSKRNGMEAPSCNQVAISRKLKNIGIDVCVFPSLSSVNFLHLSNLSGQSQAPAGSHGFGLDLTQHPCIFALVISFAVETEETTKRSHQAQEQVVVRTGLDCGATTF